MSSLAVLTHAGHAKVPEFNAILYATIATIIPVLFVAAALQAPEYDKLLTASHAAARRIEASTAMRETAVTSIIFVVTLLIPMAILIYGVAGEIQALLDLYLKRPVGLPGQLKAPGPLVAAVALTVAAAVGPATKFVTHVSQEWRATHGANGATNPPKEQQDRPAPTKGPTAPATPEPEVAPGKPSPPEPANQTLIRPESDADHAMGSTLPEGADN
jgi:hypothetical protein